MPKLPRDMSKARVIRTFMKAGGTVIKGSGKGSHQTVRGISCLLVKEMRSYTVIVHEEDTEEGTGYWASVEELPGCFASGETLDDLEKDVRERSSSTSLLSLNWVSRFPKHQKYTLLNAAGR